MTNRTIIGIFLLNGASEYLCKPFTVVDLKDRCQVILCRAKLMYQTHYLTAELEKLGHLLWLLDQSIHRHELQKAEDITAKIVN